MKFTEMMELAKAGYKPSEIAEMHKLQKEADPEEVPINQENDTAKNTLNTSAEPDKEEAPGEAEAKPIEVNEDDYKTKYEEAMAELAKAQAANVSMNIESAKPDADKAILDIINRFR